MAEPPTVGSSQCSVDCPKGRINRDAAASSGHAAAAMPVGAGGHFYVAPTSQQARDTFYPYYRAYFEQNMPRPVDHFPRTTFDEWTEPGGGLLVGSPQQVVEKLLEIHQTLGNAVSGPDRPRRLALC
jgi:alkanesulfonate monooxygenase SsuD/methylene tetrahydromethanopterin reductase-like flavin-dependent oxidoreductase (luciferase family)